MIGKLIVHHPTRSEAIACMQRALAERENKAAISVLIERGMQYDEISLAELEKFQALVRPIYETAGKKVGTDTIELALKAQKQCR